MTSPTARSLALLKNEGWTAAVVEKWISYRDAKLDAKLWEIVLQLAGAAELWDADPLNIEKKLRVVAALGPIQTLAKAYKPPVMPGIRRDPFGFADILAFRPWRESTDGNIMLVQTTSFANLNARIAKASVIPEFQGWLAAGGLVEFHGWRVRKLKHGDASTCKVVRFPESGGEDE